MHKYLGIALALTVIGCASGNCRQNRDKDPNAKANAPPASEALHRAMATAEERIRIYKYDGSLQCGQGKSVSADTMKNELKGVTVHSSESKTDGLFRTQVCGSPTGMANVFEIDKKDLAKAKKQGFKEWTFE